MNEQTAMFDVASATALMNLALLDLSEERMVSMAAIALPVHQLLKSMTAVELGTTAPATAFRASWE